MVHHYVFRVYALDTTLGLNPGTNEQQVADAMSGHIIAFGEMTATYTRPKS
jgi:hypothetical protein